MLDTGLVSLDRDDEETAHVAAILHGLTRGLVSYDAAGRIRFANRALSTILDLAPGGADAGMTLASLLEGSAVLDRAATEAIGDAASATAVDRQARQCRGDPLHPARRDGGGRAPAAAAGCAGGKRGGLKKARGSTPGPRLGS